MRNPLTAYRVRDLDPFEGFRREFDDLMRDFARQAPIAWGGAETMALPALDIAETKEAVEISAELPGVAETEVELTVEGHALVIAGEKKSEKETKDKAWNVVERSYGSFRRVVPLAFAPDPDKVHASFDKGVLHVSVGKPAEMVAKKVSVPITAKPKDKEPSVKAK